MPAPVNIIEERTLVQVLERILFPGNKSVIIGLLVRHCIYGHLLQNGWYNSRFCIDLEYLLVLAILASLQATLTLPGIAGLILTVGMSIDANVIIFERI